jgi:hypothetical protein
MTHDMDKNHEKKNKDDHDKKLNPKKYTVDDKGNIRWDYLFSYWIDVWAIFYIFAYYTKGSPGAKYIAHNMNPVLLLIVGLVDNLLYLLMILIHNPDPSVLIKFFPMIIITKIIPLYFLLQFPISIVINIIWSVIIFIIYNMYLKTDNRDFYGVYTSTRKYVLGGEDRTPMFMLMNYLTGGKS